MRNGANSSQCLGRVRRPSLARRSYSGVAGKGVICPKTGSTGGHSRIAARVRSPTPTVSLSKPKRTDVIQQTLHLAKFLTTDAYSDRLLKLLFTLARLAGSSHSI